MVVFLDLLGFGIVIPIFPNMVVDSGGNSFTVGLVIASYSFFQFLFSPILGRFSDKYGRRPILIISTFITTLSYLLIALFPTLWAFFIGRILAGIGGSNISVVQAYIADISQSHERTKLLALFGSIFSIGFIIGPFVGGFLSAEIAKQAPFYFMSILSFINIVLIFFFIKESNTSLQKHIKIEILNIKVTKELMRPKNMAFLLILFFLINFTFSLTIGIFPLYTKELFDWTEKEVGYNMALWGVLSFAMQAVGMRLLLKKLNELQVIKLSMLVFGATFIGYGFITNVPQLIVVTSLSAVGFSLLPPTIQSLISLESSDEEQGLALGVAQSFGALARIGGPLIGGAIAIYHINYPYILSGIIMLLVLLWGQQYLKESFIRKALQAKAPQ